MAKKSFSKYLTEFLEHLEIEKNRSAKTRQNYSFYLRRFGEYWGDKNPEQITAEAVRRYRLWLNRLIDVHGEPLKKNTQNYHLIALRSFLKYLAKRDVKTLAPEKIELMKMPDRVVSFLEGSDLNRLLAAPLLIDRGPAVRPPANLVMEEANRELIKYRDKAILELLFSTGLRVSELANLKKENINVKKDEFTIMGKGQKLRIVFLSEQARYWLQKYLEARPDINPCLFISHDKRTARSHQDAAGLTPRSIQRLVQKYARAAGIAKPVTPHTLRHSYATDLLQNGADIRSVQVMLGHASITTTQIYTHITDTKLRRVHKQFHGRRR